MNYISIGDIAQSFQLRRHNVQLQRHLQQLSEELTSGVKADLAEAVSGDFKVLAGIDRSLQNLAPYHTATTEAAQITASLQESFAVIQDMATQLAPGLLGVATSSDPALVDTLASDARQKFRAAVSTLNTQVGDRYLLSGAATDQKPLAGSQDILDALSLAVAGQVTASGVQAAVAAWFDAPAGGGGYLDTVYGGSASTLAPFALGEGDSALLDVTAADAPVRDMLEGLALGALLAEGVLSGFPAERTALATSAGESLFAANGQMAALRARIGTVEAHIDTAATRNAAEKSALEVARAGIVAADPYDTASALEAVQTQLETLYSLTARLSRLSLADFLR
ncbi:MAG: flagellar biosynthesis protein FlgL [Rhodobacteraceae bacterium]|nr:flagellar biosynthesis protein FlgL [Paracoccaceae bacterium]MCP5341331.1 flagellar biosynthesis protein FlgL [Paracoccaceae bacterium]